jgi:preprotein translocase subunit YajC
MIFFWIMIIAIISFLWALISLRKEKNRHEINKAKEEIAKGRVIFHSSDAKDSSD